MWVVQQVISTSDLFESQKVAIGSMDTTRKLIDF